MERRKIFAALALSVVLAGATGVAVAQQRQKPSDVPQTVSARDVVSVEAELRHRFEREAATSRAQPSTAQRSTFADGVITREEYGAAVERTVDCMRLNGVDVGSIEPSPSGRFLTFSYGFAVDSEKDAPERRQEVADTYRDCYIAELALVDAEWLRGTTLEEAERQSKLVELEECVTDARSFGGQSDEACNELADVLIAPAE